VSKRVRVLSTALAAAAATAAIAFSAAPAQAAVNSVYLYTDTLAGCTTSGTNGVAAGVFASYNCQLGFAGYSVSVKPTRGHHGDEYVYINTLTQQWCELAGSNGVAGGVFTDYYCQNGFAGYSLMVLD